MMQLENVVNYIYIYIYIYISVWDLYSSFVLSVIPFMLSFFQYGPFSQ
jgi:hypothetical protein